MATALRGRPAHAPGPTFFTYTPNGKKLITAGLNTAIKVFEHGSDGEPAVIDVSTENHTAVVATNEFFAVASESGEVTQYSLDTNRMQQILVRCSLPVRDLAISPDGQWVAVASEELEIKVVNTQDMTKVLYLRDQTRPAKHVSFDTSGSTLAVSCTDGIMYIYSFSSEQPQLVKRIDGVIQMLEPNVEASTKAQWHPDGRSFVVPSQTRDMQVVARSDWQRQKPFTGAHRADITAFAWSPNGGLLVTSALDKSLVLWETKTQKTLKTLIDIRDAIVQMQWHPRDNVLSYTNNNGELFIHEGFVTREHVSLLSLDLQPSPLLSDPLSVVSGNVQKQRPLSNGLKRSAEDDYLDELLGPDAMSTDGDGFIEDDDGAGYAEEPNQYGKRNAATYDGPLPKRPATHNTWQPGLHVPFQPGSTPWKGNRRYLCLNLTGFVWTVNQETHNTVTVEFYDRQEHRDFHFTDPYQYDKACLNGRGAVFSCPPSAHHPAVIYYRPHETWTARVDWRIQLPAREEVTSISLSDSYIVATTTAGYVRVYSLFGVPLKIYRQKSAPAVTCASWRDYIMTVGNGYVGGDGLTRLLYTIENVKRDEICQNEDIIALPRNVSLQCLFFSDRGDPCIYDSDGVLLVLLHWRSPGQAKWVPLLDTRTLDRLAGGKKRETYWPVAVAESKFHCIILKGGEDYPYFPRPLLSDFEFHIPVSAAPSGDEAEDQEATQRRSLEEQYVRYSLQHSLLDDLVQNTKSTSLQKAEVPMLEREVDKVLLQLLAAECREGEERGMKALEIAALMKDRTGKMLEAAAKVAARFQRDLLGEKMNELAERRIVGLVEEDDL